MKFSRYIMLALKGCAMGMADVVPGVSGGTIAFISGIYEELTVLNFGTTLASGAVSDVLNDPAVVRAYLGD